MKNSDIYLAHKILSSVINDPLPAAVSYQLGMNAAALAEHINATQKSIQEMAKKHAIVGDDGQPVFTRERARDGGDIQRYKMTPEGEQAFNTEIDAVMNVDVSTVVKILPISIRDFGTVAVKPALFTITWMFSA